MDQSPTRGPAEVYRAQLEDRSRRLDRATIVEDRIATTRGIVALATIAVAWEAIGGRIAASWLFLPCFGFLGLVWFHARTRRRARSAGRAVAFYRRGLDRVEDRWANLGPDRDGRRFADPGHLFAADLDLFGPGSLFERVNSARTGEGEAALAGLLKRPEATPETILSRQEAVADLGVRLDLREDLDSLGEGVRHGLDSVALLEWADRPPALPNPRFRRVAAVLGGLSLATLIGWAWPVTGPAPFLSVVLIQVAFWATLRRRIATVLAPIEPRAAELALISGMLARLEREPFEAELLRAIHGRIIRDGEPPSRRIARLVRLVRRIESRKNPLIAPFAAMMMSGTRLSFEVEAWRRQSGRALADWISAIAEIEAFASLGSYAFETPDDAVAEIIPSGARFEGEAVGHPLLPAARCVRNSISLGGATRALMVSGSNMSGKSTMLRTVGITAVLALVGAPVRARSLRISPLTIGATLRIEDSLQAGRSRFFAELGRLAAIVGRAGGAPPLLFLLDEIFSGTNSEDRRIGSDAVLRDLVARGSIGLVTTHDLALASLADASAPSVVNVHFADRFDAGSLEFDYTMRQGVVTRSNAIALMRAVGLDVGTDSSLAPIANGDGPARGPQAAGGPVAGPIEMFGEDD